MRLIYTRFLPTLVIFLGLLVSRCGNDDGSSGEGSDSDSDMDTDADTDTDSDSDTDSDTDTGPQIEWDTEVVIEWVEVGDTGNKGEMSGKEAGGYGEGRICGAVDYVYLIGKYEITNEQYINFLNAVARTDTYSLYHPQMNGTFGGITRYGQAGNYVYGPKDNDPNWLQRPVSYVNFWDAARFANWIHNGKPSGDQDQTSTEDGAYSLDGQTGAGGESIVRKQDALTFIPTEDEWYKAAYYEPPIHDGVGGYFDYPTKSNTPPIAEAPPGTNKEEGSANYYIGTYLLGAPYYTTEVGAYTTKPSTSYFGTYDQGGNQWEWVETLAEGSDNRGLRGGSYYAWDTRMSAAYRVFGSPSLQDQERGFRLASKPKKNSPNQDTDRSQGPSRRAH